MGDAEESQIVIQVHEMPLTQVRVRVRVRVRVSVRVELGLGLGWMRGESAQL